MHYKELQRRMGPYNPDESHHARMTRQGIILAKDRKAKVQAELDRKIAAKSKALAKKTGKRKAIDRPGHIVSKEAGGDGKKSWGARQGNFMKVHPLDR